VVRTLDDIADRFRLEHPNFYFLSTRQKALALARWLRAHNLTGMDNPHENYRNLRNCFIGHALSDPDHPSLPIISSAIFTCVAQRLGLKAFCLAFPNHVHAAVYAPAGQDLDGNYTRDTNPEKTRMYFPTATTARSPWVTSAGAWPTTAGPSSPTPSSSRRPCPSSSTAPAKTSAPPSTRCTTSRAATTKRAR
jgi:hypothetical protein